MTTKSGIVKSLLIIIYYIIDVNEKKRNKTGRTILLLGTVEEKVSCRKPSIVVRGKKGGERRGESLDTCRVNSRQEGWITQEGTAGERAV